MHSSLQIFWQIAEQHGPTAISERILGLHAYAKAGLRRKGVRLISDWHKGNQSGILNFVPRSIEPNYMRKQMADAGIAVSVRGGGVCLAIHAYNTTEEIDRMLQQVG